MIALTAAALLTPTKRVEMPLVLIEDGVIVEVASHGTREIPTGCTVMDFSEDVLAPGFVDLHLHGGAGWDVMDPAPEALPAVEKLVAGHGVTAFFPTTVTASLDATLRALERLARAVERAAKGNEGLRARPLGIHLEGPFISHARRGVHPPEHLLPPTSAAFERFWEAASGHIRMMTIAPELPGALEVIAQAAVRGVCLSAGHSDANLTEMRAGVEAGVRHATHTFNAMRPLGHRDPGIVGEILTDERVSADIIADGIHLDPAVVKLFLECKSHDKAVLITDATAATGMPDGRYRLGAMEVEVREGRCLSEGRLAGSVLTMDRAVRNTMKFGEWSLMHAVQAATLNPAKVANLPWVGRVETGARADFVVLSSHGEVRRTIIGGRVA